MKFLLKDCHNGRLWLDYLLKVHGGVQIFAQLCEAINHDFERYKMPKLIFEEIKKLLLLGINEFRCEAELSFNHSIKTLHLRYLLFSCYGLLVVVLFRLMCFYVLYNFKYFIATHTLFAQFSNKVDNFFSCHTITHFLFTAFRWRYYIIA